MARNQQVIQVAQVLLKYGTREFMVKVKSWRALTDEEVAQGVVVIPGRPFGGEVAYWVWENNENESAAPAS